MAGFFVLRHFGSGGHPHNDRDGMIVWEYLRKRKKTSADSERRFVIGWFWLNYY